MSHEIPSERICGIDLYGIYRRGPDVFRVVTMRIGGAIGAPIFDGLVELVPKEERAT